MEIQDDIATAITGTLWSYRGTIREAERDNLCQKLATDFNAFDFILKGIHHKEQYTAESMLEAHEHFDRAIEFDPDCADAKRAIAIDPFSEMGHWSLAAALVMDKDYERGFAEYDRAMEINPNNPDLMVTKGCDLSICGRYEEGIALILQGIQFNKHHPDWYFWHLGMAYFVALRDQEAIATFNRMNQQNEDTLLYQVACYALSGELDKAEKQLDELYRLNAQANLEQIAESHEYLSEDGLKRLIDGVSLAMGIQEPKSSLRAI